MSDRLQRLVGRLRTEQSGAIMLLLLAAFLILFMCTLVVYDAGRSSQDKMDVQFSADSAAYSHSVVKARGMNLIAYANTIKRMLFSYLAAYANAWISIIIVWAYHFGECFDWTPRPSSCRTWAAAIPMIFMEGLELFLTNMPATAGGIADAFSLFQTNETPSKQELMSLERYQQYIYSVTPWWSYVEGTLRGMRNGAYIAGSWPPPTSNYGQLRGVPGVGATLNSADNFFGTNFANAGPSANIDALPAARRDRAGDNWNNPGEPFVYEDFGPNTFGAGPFGINSDAISAGFDYCINYSASIESLVSLAQVVMESDDDPDGWKQVFVVSHILPSIGCGFAAFVYNQFGYLDWRIPERLASSGVAGPEWWQATSSLSLSYKPREGRNDIAAGERRKFTYLSDEAVFDRDAYANEGYFGMARSEIVYKQPFELMNTLEDWVNQVPIISGFLAQRAGVQDSPDLWSPRWKSKNRPVMLPNEQFGSVIESGNVGFNVVTRDLLPWIALASAAGLIPGGQAGGTDLYGAGSAAHDMAYLFRAGRNFGFNEAQGLAK